MARRRDGESLHLSANSCDSGATISRESMSNADASRLWSSLIGSTPRLATSLCLLPTTYAALDTMASSTAMADATI